MENYAIKEHFSDVERTQCVIAGLMKKHRIVNEVVIQNNRGTLDPLTRRIVKTGALIVEIVDGLPTYIYSLCGKLKLESAGYYNYNPLNQDKLFQEMKKLFGMVALEPTIYYKKNGNEGTLYALTRVPWDKNKVFPTVSEEVIFGVKKGTFLCNEKSLHGLINSDATENYQKKQHFNYAVYDASSYLVLSRLPESTVALLKTDSSKEKGNE